MGILIMIAISLLYYRHEDIDFTINGMRPFGYFDLFITSGRQTSESSKMQILDFSIFKYFILSFVK
jgi:hypothetical protein